MARECDCGDACNVNTVDWAASGPEGVEATGIRRILRSPAERPPGKRGLRGVAACVAAAGALVPLAFSSGTGDPGWVRPVFISVAVGMTLGATLLWVARRPVTLALGIGLLLLSVAGGVEADRAESHAQHEADKWTGASWHAHEKGRLLTLAEARAVPEGVTKNQLKALLGPAAGSGVQQVEGEKDLRCIAYRSHRGQGLGRILHAFCFTDGRYTDLREW